MRATNRLSAIKVTKIKTPGYYPDGAGLYLQVSATGTKSWVHQFTLNGKTREMGLGALADVTLAEAREMAASGRKLLKRGTDPIEERRRAREAARLAANKHKNFKQATEEFLEANETSWGNTKHRAQWRSTLETYAYPTIGHLSVQEIDSNHIADLLRPLYATKRETAKRVRGRIERVFGFAKAKGYRAGANPARWRDNIKNLVSAPQRAAPKHHEALPYDDMPDFMAALRGEEGIAPEALQFTIFTIARTAETIGARPDEFDLDAGIWTVPADRMKMKREHRVPLSAPAIAIVKARIEAGGELLFPGMKKGKPLSNMAMLKLLDRMGYEDLTVHGFRSTFKDWASDRTGFPDEVSEAALAHSIKDKTEAAYRRTDLFEKRRKLMDAWATYCGLPKGGKVVAIVRARGGQSK